MARSTNTRFAVAVHVLTYLAAEADSGPVSSDELARSTNTNPVYVRRVLGPLREAGLVRARPGSHGGWELGRPAADLRLDEVWSIVQGGDGVLGRHGPNPKCPVGAGVEVALDRVDAEVAGALLAGLGRHTIAGVLADAHGHAGAKSR